MSTKTNQVVFPSGHRTHGTSVFGNLPDATDACIGSAYGTVDPRPGHHWTPASVPTQLRNARLFAAATDMEQLLFEASQRHIPAELRRRIAHVLELIDTDI